MRFPIDDIIAVIPPLLAFFAVGFSAGVLTLVLTRRTNKAEANEHKPHQGTLLRLVAWILTALFGAGITFGLVLLLIYWIHDNSSDADKMYWPASFASIGGFLLGAGILTMIPWFAGPSPGNSKSVPVSLWVAAWTLLIVGFVLGFALCPCCRSCASQS